MRRLAIALAVALVPTLALATFDHPTPGEIALRDMPGSDGTWQEARALIDAPPDAVWRWLTDYPDWPRLFHDVSSAEVLDRHGDVTRIRLRSRIADRTMTMDVRRDGSGISYTSVDGSIHASGRIFITPTAGDRTDVIMQTTADVGGLLGAFATRGMIRDRSRRKLAADLHDLIRLARERQMLSR